MEINVGDYVRTKYGRVGKVFDITNEPSVDVGIGIIPEVNAVWIDTDKINYLYQEEITKHSKDILDIIEVGDFVKYKQSNMYWNIPTRVSGRYNRQQQLTELMVDDTPLKNVEITSILTQESFEANAYTIEKERCNCEIIYKTK